MKSLVRAQLCFMMFLEFFIWGAWFVTLGTFLGNNLKATDGEIALAFSTQSWGAIIAPFVIGIIADRYFNAERILGVLHILGGVLMYFMYGTTEFDDYYFGFRVYDFVHAYIGIGELGLFQSNEKPCQGILFGSCVWNIGLGNSRPIDQLCV